MKRSLLILLLLPLSLLSSNILAQSYEKMWNKVSEYQKKDLPQSVIKQSLAIYQKALNDKNSPQMLKAYLTAMEYRSFISQDSVAVDISFLEKWGNQTSRIDEKAILNTVIASVVADKDGRRSLSFIEKAMRNTDALASISASMYAPIVTGGNMSQRYFNDNLLHILSSANLSTLENIDHAPVHKRMILGESVKSLSDFIKADIGTESEASATALYLKLYQLQLKAYQKVGLIDAWIITAGDVIKMLGNYSNVYDESCRLADLNGIIGEYSKNESVAYLYSILLEDKLRDAKYADALNLIEKCTSLYPKYVGICQFQQTAAEIKRPQLSGEFNNVYALLPTKITISYKCTPSCKIKLYRLRPEVTPLYLANSHDKSDLLKKHASLVKEDLIKLRSYSDYARHDTLVDYRINTPGIYYLAIETDNDVASGEILSVTSLLPIAHPLPGNKIEFIALDALNGKPVAGAKLNIYSRTDGTEKYRQTACYPFGKDGRVVIDASEKIDRYNVTTKDDDAMPLSYLNVSPYRSFTDYKKENVTLFTDRSIYKPGQTVSFGGVAYTQQVDSTHVLPAKEYEAQLLDANRSIISTIVVTTDKFGGFSGKFTLPQRCMNGSFCIRVISCTTSFMVEEYKRPALRVTLEPIKQTYSIGDTVMVKGNVATLFGMPLPNSVIKYRVEPRNSRLYYGSNETGEFEKSIKSDEKGCFTIPVAMNAVKGMAMRGLRYDVNVVATDLSGQSAAATTSVFCSDSSFRLYISGIEAEMLKESNDSITYSLTNYNGEEIDISVGIKLYKIEENRNDSTLIVENTVEANEKVSTEWLKSMPSGQYRLFMIATSEDGKEQICHKDFVLFSINDKRPPVTTDCWIYEGNEKNDILSFGTSKSDVDIYYTLFASDKVIESKVFNVTDSLVSLSCKYDSKYGDGADMSIVFVKDGKLYYYPKKIVKPLPKKSLTLKWSSFRDKLQPGAKETWKLKICDEKGRPVSAQLISTMYDASLDEIYKSDWNFSIRYTRDVYIYPWRGTRGSNGYMESLAQYSYQPCLTDYSQLSIPLVSSRRRMLPLRLLVGNGMKSGIFIRGNAMAMPKMMDSAMPQSTIDAESLRKNFSETAFFYPQLNTDRNGEVNISFLLPESMTNWHFRGFAHTADVDYGFIEGNVTTAKEFMVRPQMPRFMRAGDNIIIPVSVTNLKEKDLRGDIRLEMIEPMTNKVVYSASQKLDVDDGATSLIEFDYSVPQEYQLLVCRIIAHGRNFSDGEQNYIALLSDKEMVTESVPMIMTKPEKYSYNIKASADKAVTLQVTANPIWHVVQALPFMMSVDDDVPFDWATSLYATFINEHIVGRNPSIKNYVVLPVRKDDDKQNNMLESELQKNQELKQILLDETPWLASANSEREQRELLSTLADMNTISYNKKMAVDHLADLQNSDGSWNWRKGMGASEGVTADIVQLLSRLKSRIGSMSDNKVENLYSSAFGYLKTQARKEYDEYHKNDKTSTASLPEWVTKYLYICSLDKSLAYNKEVNRFFIDRLMEKPAGLDIYNKGMMAVVLYRNGMKKDAATMLQSLLEYTVYNKDMGRYFDTSKAYCNYSSNIIPSVVATIEALQLDGGNKEYIDQMKLWILYNKGVQTWGSNVATTNAIYALIGDGGMNGLDDEAGVMKIKAGDFSATIGASEPLGYIKERIDSGVKTVSIDKGTRGLSWGSIYIQGMQKVDTLAASSTGMSIEKRIFQGEKMVDANSLIKVGDILKVVLKIKSQSSMDFVQIKEPLYACMQPVNQLSSMKWNSGMAYSEQIKSASMNFFIDKLDKGEHLIEYYVYVTNRGDFKCGLTSGESAYFPMIRTYCSSPRLIVR